MFSTPLPHRSFASSTRSPISVSRGGKFSFSFRPTIKETSSSRFVSFTFSVWIDLPSRMTVTRSQISKISGIRWEMKIIEIPFSFRLWISRNRMSTWSTVRGAVGSSRIRILVVGLEMAFAISTICL